MSARPAVQGPRHFWRGFGVGVALVGLATLSLVLAPFVLTVVPSW